MKSIKAIIRPEQVFHVLDELEKEGFCAVTRLTALGRGNQRGLKVGEVYYDEIPKEILIMVVEDEECEKAVSIIEKEARTNNGSHGDGKIFITTVEKAVTISNGKRLS